MKLVGISGKAGTGKDWVFRNVLRPLGFRNWSLAWHFKVWLVGRSAATHDEVFHTKPEHVRTLLQQEGTERGRLVYGEDVWCNTALEWFRLLEEEWGCDKWVVPDVRFPNEVQFIQQAGGRVYRINAPLRESTAPLTPTQRQHISETALDNFPGFDGVLLNDPNDPPVKIQLLYHMQQHGLLE